MIRGPRLFALIALAGLALASLLLAFRSQPGGTAEPTRLSTEYFFRDAEISLIGSDGSTTILVNAGKADRAFDNEALTLEAVRVRREGPQSWSLTADTAKLPHEGGDMTAEDNVRLTFGPAGQWVADALEARITAEGPSLTLRRQFRIHRPDGSGGGSEISGEHIVLEPESMKAETDQRVRLKVGGAEFEANGLIAHIGEQLITLDRNVRLVRDE